MARRTLPLLLASLLPITSCKQEDESQAPQSVSAQPSPRVLYVALWADAADEQRVLGTDAARCLIGGSMFAISDEAGIRSAVEELADGSPKGADGSLSVDLHAHGDVSWECVRQVLLAIVDSRLPEDLHVNFRVHDVVIARGDGSGHGYVVDRDSVPGDRGFRWRCPRAGQALPSLPGTVRVRGKEHIPTTRIIVRPINECRDTVYEVEGVPHQIRTTADLATQLAAIVKRRNAFALVRARGDVRWRYAFEAMFHAQKAGFNEVHLSAGL